MRYRALDGWRGIAALTVAVFHSPFESDIAHLAPIRNATFMVDFLFVLSGFVLTHAHLRRPETYTAFVIRRVGRLWPLHLAILSMFVLLELTKLVLLRGHGSELAPFTGEFDGVALIANVFLVQALGTYDHLTWNGPAWSISTELYVSLLFGWIVVRRTRFLLRAALLIGTLAAVAIVFAAWQGPIASVVRVAPFRCLYGFFTGVALYLLLPRLPERAAILEAVALAAVAAFMCATAPFLQDVAAAPFFAFVVYAFAADRGPVSRLLQAAPFQAMGRWSYSIYLVNYLVCLAMMRAAHVAEHLVHRPLMQIVDHGPKIEFATPLLMDAGTLVYALIVVGVSAFTFQRIEEPWRKWSARRASLRAARASPLAYAG